ncbi:unnamed protein product [Cuscuta europaea]|uniref:Uncharacterized protein n=1 Tax=Cuscuta europaea TaxID=41803 RepID=A0A9P1E2G1_CUSEU|nr:unnamed protein product [Cuscuta europaea]
MPFHHTFKPNRTNLTKPSTKRNMNMPNTTSPTPPQNPPPQDFFQQLLEGQQALLARFNTMNLNYTNMGEQLAQVREEQRAGFQRMEELRQADLHRYEEDYRRVYGPIDSYIAHHGDFSSITSPPPAPSWYNPSDWGNFGGSSSGGGGYNGGDTLWETVMMYMGAALEVAIMAEKAGTRDSAMIQVWGREIHLLDIIY